MKKMVFLIGIVLLLGIVFVFSQVPSKTTTESNSKSEPLLVKENKLIEYIPQIIIEGKWGASSGEFGMVMFEGAPAFPESLVVDSKGNIIILDTYNNRIQIFDSRGKYISSIPVESYQRSTADEVERSKNTWNKLGLDFSTVYACSLYIDPQDSLYLQQERRSAVTRLPDRFLKYTKVGQETEIEPSEFDKVKKQVEPEQIFIKSRNKKYLVELGDRKNNQEQDIKIYNLSNNQSQNIPFKLQYSITRIGFVKVDSNNNIYIFTEWPPQIHKYSLEGNILSLVNLEGLPNPYGKHPILNSIPYIDSVGNIFQMELIPNPDQQIAYFPKESLGLKIIKWEVK